MWSVVSVQLRGDYRPPLDPPDSSSSFYFFIIGPLQLGLPFFFFYFFFFLFAAFHAVGSLSRFPAGIHCACANSCEEIPGSLNYQKKKNKNMIGWITSKQAKSRISAMSKKCHQLSASVVPKLSHIDSNMFLLREASTAQRTEQNYVLSSFRLPQYLSPRFAWL